jgi:hypothetical protein
MRQLHIQLVGTDQLHHQEFVENLQIIKNLSFSIWSKLSPSVANGNVRSDEASFSEIVILFVPLGALPSLLEFFKFWVNNRPKAKLILRISDKETVNAENISLDQFRDLLENGQ